MSVIIKVKRGEKVDLPETGSPGEPHYTTDTKELYIAGNNTTVYPVKLLSTNIIDKSTADGVAGLDVDTNVVHNIKTDNLFFHSASEVQIDYNQNILIESLSIAEFRMATWVINVADQQTGEFYSCQITAHHNGSTAEFTEFAVIGEETVGFSVTVEATNLRLYGLSTKNGQVVRLVTTAIRFT